ncbi:MAG: helix-turn-helix transcriptional regulator [Chloroflexi bacterium]|nr:helix-turn-helix transcriptional regulator [Chloroflexota bacterium]
MEASLTFGEYVHRLRRAHKWNLHALSEHSGISYTHLSRIENDSVLPTAESVARLAQALDGDLKAMLELADCLPKVILDRISAQEQPVANSLLRTAGSASNGLEEPVPGLDHALALKLKEFYGLDDLQAGALALAIDGLVNLDQFQRSSIFSVIASISAQGK